MTSKRIAGSIGAGRWKGWPWYAWLALAAAALLSIFLVPRFFAIFWFYSGTDFFKALLYEKTPLGDAWSSFFAYLISFGYGIALVSLLGWGLWKVVSGTANGRQIAAAFIAYVVVFALPHFILGVTSTWIDPGICANQRTGDPIRWYVALPGGEIVLYDSPGFDKFGNERRPATPEICQIFDQQHNGKRPQRITADPRDVQFFSPISGVPIVWYSVSPEGGILLFDARGFDPTTSELLEPITQEIALTAQSTAELKQPRSPQSAHASKQCPGKIMPELVLGGDWVQVNEGNCHVVFEILSGDVVFETTNGNYTFGAADTWIEGFRLAGVTTRVRSHGDPARLKYSLCPPSLAGQRIGWDCAPAAQ